MVLEADDEVICITMHNELLEVRKEEAALVGGPFETPRNLCLCVPKTLSELMT